MIVCTNVKLAEWPEFCQLGGFLLLLDKAIAFHIEPDILAHPSRTGEFRFEYKMSRRRFTVPRSVSPNHTKRWAFLFTIMFPRIASLNSAVPHIAYYRPLWQHWPQQQQCDTLSCLSINVPVSSRSWSRFVVNGNTINSLNNASRQHNASSRPRACNTMRPKSTFLAYSVNFLTKMPGLEK